jgi:hypothetical protein
MRKNFNICNYDPREHPCRNCDKRHAFCHGECELYKEFNATKPKKPQNTYVEMGKCKDPFHKKGRILTK